MATANHKRCTTLDELAERLRTTDLVPSQRPLLDRLDERFALLAAAGITSVADLLAKLKDKRSVPPLAEASGVDEDYLVLLGRAVRGFFPKPARLRAFDWIDADVIAALEAAGIKDSEQLRAAWQSDAPGLAERTSVSVAELSALAELSDLVRVQWVSPTYARALVAAGYASVAAVADADPEALVRDLAAANERHRFFDATIGLRDIRRTVDAAAYAVEP